MWVLLLIVSFGFCNKTLCFIPFECFKATTSGFSHQHATIRVSVLVSRFLLCFVVMIPMSFIHRFVLSPFGKHLYAALSGAFLSYLSSKFSSNLHFLVSMLLGYLTVVLFWSYCESLCFYRSLNCYVFLSFKLFVISEWMVTQIHGWLLGKNLSWIWVIRLLPCKLYILTWRWCSWALLRYGLPLVAKTIETYTADLLHSYTAEKLNKSAGKSYKRVKASSLSPSLLSYTMRWWLCTCQLNN